MLCWKGSDGDWSGLRSGGQWKGPRSAQLSEQRDLVLWTLLALRPFQDLPPHSSRAALGAGEERVTSGSPVPDPSVSPGRAPSSAQGLGVDGGREAVLMGQQID